MALKKFRLAIKDLDKGIARHPEIAIAYTNRGNAYAGLKDIGRACQNWRKSCEAGQQSTCAWLKKNPGFCREQPDASTLK